MVTENGPRMNSWYETDDGAVFLVTAIDAEKKKIETQYLDGSVDELSMDSWGDMTVQEIQPPEDWQGSMDEAQSDWKEYQK